MRTHSLVAVAALAIALSVPVAAGAADNAEEAKKHFTTGMRYYTLEKYDEAIKEFEAGFLMFPDPAFLYNLGQCYRLSEPPRPAQALGMYRKYLKLEPRAKQRAEVEKLVGKLQKTIEEIKAKKDAEPPPDHTPDAPAEKPVLTSTSKPATAPTATPATTTTTKTPDPKATKETKPAVAATTTSTATKEPKAATTTPPASNPTVASTTTPPPPAAPAPIKPKNVPPNFLDGQAIARPTPHLPSAAKILHEGGDEEPFTAKVCVDKEGKVFHVGVLKGIVAADDEIVAVIKTWKYKPQTIPVCFIANWVFSFKS